tara:strand:- start:63591 stop:65396 length:1806 start_codon:yes stop_codon:yes gene_type:complete
LKWRYAPALALACFAGQVVAKGDPVMLENVRVGLHQDMTRVVFDLTDSVRYQAVPQQNQSILVLEFTDTVAEKALFDTPLAKASIDKVQFEELENGTLRVELKLKGDLHYSIFPLSPHLDKGYRLVVDLANGADTATTLAGDGSVAAEAVTLPAGKSQSARAGRTSTLSKSSRKPPPPGPRKLSPIRFGGTWEQEWALEKGGHSQKFESLIEPRLEMGLTPGVELTAIARIRLDAVGDLGPDEDKPDNYSSINGPLYNDTYAEFSLRELYLDTRWSDSYWRIGKQQVVWGQADGIKVLDVVNPQSYREFILDDFDRSRIPLTMVNVEMPVGQDTTLQLLWIPDTTYHELAEFDTPYYITSPLLVPTAPAGVAVEIRNPDVPDNAIDDSDIGGRISGFWGGWDVTINYLYHYQDAPVLYQEVKFTPGGVLATVSPEYERNHMTGGTLSNAFGDFTLRAEVAYNTDTFQISQDISSGGIADSAELGSVIGLDWQLGSYDTLVSAQWFQSHLFDYDSSIYRDKTEHNLSLYYQRDFANETWQFNALALYSVNNQDSLIQAKLKYFWRSNLEVWLGADIFSGDSEGIYGQFRNYDRMLLGLELGF